MALAPILFNGETIGAAYAPSLNAAFAELYELSGIKPEVRAPYGGARTADEQRQINPGQTVSDHVKERAVDIWNHQLIRNRIGSARFVAVLASRGWRNVQINGAPFPDEPWHFANQSSTPQGGNATVIEADLIRKVRKRNMTTRYALIGSSVNGDGGKGQVCALAGDVGSPCPGNWDEYVRPGTASDRATQEFQIHGPAIWLSKADWAVQKAKYTTP